MVSETALVTQQPSGLARWSTEQVDVLRQLICPGASDAELELFGQVCQRTGLDPFARQIYGLMRGQNVKVGNEWKYIEKLSIQTSIDGFRLIAERSGRYGGQDGPYWCGEDGIWRDVWLGSEYPAAAKVGVIRTDWQAPLYATARWASYVQTFTRDKQQVVGAMWQKMPDVMLAKVAEALALRRAFPQELSGLYTADEMAQADRVEVVTKPPEPFAYTDDQRETFRAEYARLAVLAGERGHKHAAKIQAKAPADLTDAELAAAIDALQRWERSLPAEDAG